MSAYRVEQHNLDGRGWKGARVYPMPPAALKMYPDGAPHPTAKDYWTAVTDVPCPSACGGTVRWAEAGYVPGYRICDVCGKHFLARGTKEAPTLVRVGRRRS
jgi:hypothetical protein